MASTSTAVNLPANCCYEVFLNHRGSDTKKNIASHISRRLVLHGIQVFWDKEEMQVGDDLTCQIQDAIKTASVHVAIFSPHYAESKWCLEELHLMVQSGKPIIPVFYKIKPGELKRAQGDYAKALQQHGKKTTHDSQPRYNSITIGNWRTALYTVAEISGLELDKFELDKFNGDEGELVDAVVDSVCRKLRGTRRLDVAEHPTGLDEKIEDFEKKMLSVQSDKARVIGIVGMGGIGKTTLVKELFNWKKSKYSKSCFLADVRENARKASLESLQEKLLEGLTALKGEKIGSVSEGIELLKNRLKSFQALVILDDVDHFQQLDALLRPIRDVLHSSSLILITSRDRDVLTRSRVEESSIYTLTGLNPQHSKELFCLHAFTQRHPLQGFEHLVDKFLKACDRLPLSLKVFGGLLYGNDEKSFWEDQLERLEQILPEDIKTRLQVSYDLLQDDEKQMFLDIACFFIGESRDKAIRIWKGCGLTGSLGFRTLQNKSLVEVDIGVDPYDVSKIRIRMHDHLRDLGRDLARDPRLPRRIWRMEDLEDLLQQPSGVTEVRGISVISGTRLKGPSFSRHKMWNLRLLDIQDDHESFYTWEGIMNAVESSNLIWLRLEVGPFSHWPLQILLDSRIQLMNLRVLEGDTAGLLWENLSALGSKESQISFSGIRSPSHSFGNLGNIDHIRRSRGRELGQLSVTFGDRAYLGHLNLSGCRGLEQLPDTFGNLGNLQHLNLSDCWGLKQLPDTFGNLANLQHINLSNCRVLLQLPDTFGNLGNLQHLHLSRCHGLKQLPDTFGNLGNLQHLHLSDLPHVHLSGCHGLKQLPDTFGNLGNLQHLDLSHCGGLKQLPDTFGNLGNLQHLDLSFCRGLKQLPDTFGNLGNLRHLHLFVCGLKQLPDTFGNLGNLQHLDLTGCHGLKQLPDTFGNLGNLQHLDLSDCHGLKQLPDTFGNLGNLQHLDLSRCRGLKQLSDTFGNLGNLQHLDLSDCRQLKQLPDTFGNLGNLHHLDLSDCRELKQLPDTFGNLGNLQHLDLSGCWKLKQLPDTFGNLGNLQHLDLSGCRELKQLPDTFGNLGNLQHLDLSKCSGLKQLPGTFGNLINLQYINLSKCSGLKQLPGTFENLRGLQYFDLSGCNPSTLLSVPSHLHRFTQPKAVPYYPWNY